MENCLFCKIAAGKIPAKQAGESERVIAFHDIRPKAPVHILIIPKIHRTRPSELTSDELREMFDLTEKVAAELGVAESGFRLVLNVGTHAGQEVEHVHLHLIGGRPAGVIY